jgi:spermidine/putrescine transport system permease protein|tara:strand:+ start:1606 stop:2556 length:951 start_codon:yes stop_codon:yes gene_type:complete
MDKSNQQVFKFPESKLEHLKVKQRTMRNYLLSAPALFILAIAASGPLLIMLFYSFLTADEWGGVVWQGSLQGWFEVFMRHDIFDGTLLLADAHLSIFWRSIKLSLVTTLLCIVFGFPTAYFIATRPRNQRSFWLFLVTVPFWTNLLIRTFAIMQILSHSGFVNKFLQSLGLIEEPLRLLYTETAVTIGMAYVYLPLMVLPLYATIERLDFRLLEAAYDLYASRLQVLRRVIIPLVKPGLVAGSILVFIPSIGAYVTPRLLGGGKSLMLGNLIELQFGQGRNWPLGAALSITLLVIVMVAMLFYVRSTSRSGVSHAH